MKTIKSVMSKALILVLLFTVICGVIYPLAVTGISQVFFRDQANGSIIQVDGRKYGSELLGQQFTGSEYMWGRVMNVDTDTFTDDQGNKVMYSWASNKSPAGRKLSAEDENEYLADQIAERVELIKAANPDADTEKIPVDLVTCSGSGLDPEISLAAAKYQIPRIAKERNMEAAQVEGIMDACTKGRLLGVFGEPRVNVLKVNLMLDGILK